MERSSEGGCVMRKWNLIIDIDKCHNCANCFIAAKDEYVGNEFPGYSAAQPLHGHEWITIEEHSQGSFPVVETRFVPSMCNHCDDAPCKEVGGDAVKKRADGIVIIDPVKARGRRDIAEACPYDAIWWNEELNLPQHWTFDAHLLDQGWKEPRCAQVCPTGAITAQKVTDSDMQSVVITENLRPIKAAGLAKPRVFYKNLDSIETWFLAGTVVSQNGEGVNCVEGAEVTLCDSSGAVLVHTSTDCFGDFRFDKLTPSSGRYLITVLSDGQTAKAEVALEASQHVGEIVLTNASRV